MAQQPLPTIGSVSLFFHLLINGIAFVGRHKRLFLGVLGIVCISLMVVWGMKVYTPEKARVPVVQIAADRHQNEKYEAITDLSFIKEQHFTAWLPWWDEERVMDSLQQASEAVDVISPVWYNLGKDGTLGENPAKRKADIMHIAGSSGIMVAPSINNEDDTGFDGKRVSILLQNKNLQEKLVQSLISIAETEGYSGWDLDWEQKDKADKDAYTAFVAYAAKELHNHGLTLSVTVQAKIEQQLYTEDDTADDWESLARHADEVRIMVYDFHYDASEPGAITPLNDLETVLDYAIKTIPLDKITLGVPMYGYDWDEEKGESVQYADAKTRIETNKGSIIRDTETEELIGQYTENNQEHTLWYTDTKSIVRILYIANNYDVKNIALWRLGREDPTIWKLR